MPMDNRLIAVIGAIAALGLGGCAGSVADVHPPAGSVAAGTAKVSTGGRQLAVSNIVSCSNIGSTVTIRSGDDHSGLTAQIDESGPPAAQFVEIRNLGGFTGDFRKQVEGTADVKLVGTNYVIAVTAAGYDTDRPSYRATRDFEMRVAC